MIKIARIAVTLGLLSSLGAQAYAAGLVVNDNDLRNDLAWLSDRGVIHLSLLDLAAQPGRDCLALKKAKPSYSSEQVVLALYQPETVCLKSGFPGHRLHFNRSAGHSAGVWPDAAGG